jgi:hypothetical protein
MFHRLVSKPSVPAGIGLGGAMGVAALASGYYGIFAIALVGLATFLWMQRSRQYWIAVAVAALTMAVLVLPVFVPYLSARAVWKVTSPSSPDQIGRYSAHWIDYFTSGTAIDHPALTALANATRAYMPAGAFQTANEVLFPGFVLSALALTGLLVHLFSRGHVRTVLGYLAIGAAALWASFGPSAGLYSVMAHTLPGISLLRAPVRLGVVVIFAVAVLAGFALRHVRRPWLLAILGAVVVAELWVPWPLRAKAPEPRPYHVLRDLPRGGVVEFPFPYVRTDFHSHTRAMLRSTANWQPLVNGYSDFIPDTFYDIAVPINGFPDEASFRILRDHRVRYAIVRVSEYGGYQQELLNRFPRYAAHLRLIADEDSVRLYEIVSWPQ